MNPDIVVDIGNTRMKWGRCAADSVAESAVLSYDDSSVWDVQRRRWNIGTNAQWATSDVAPARFEAFNAWLQHSGSVAVRINDAEQLPLETNVDRPDWVGIDRLLDAVAVNSRRAKNRPAIVIDAGSAITVDLVDEQGVFQGGAILPGIRLLTKSLHDYTALLPNVSISESLPPYPAKSTEDAIRSGVYWMAVGGINAFIDQIANTIGDTPGTFLTGGDGPLLQPVLDDSVVLWPNMTLEGIRLTALTLSQTTTE